MKIIFAFALLPLLLLGLFQIWGTFVSSPTIPFEGFTAALHLPTPNKPTTLLFVGDIMLDRGVEFTIKKNNNDWAWPFRAIAPLLQEGDIIFGNLESQIAENGTNVGSDYSFRADPKTIQGLTYAGFTILSVANNHSLDYTHEALEESLTLLNEAGITPIGGGFSDTEAYGVVIKEINNARIGFLAYTNSGAPAWAATQNQSGIAWIDEENIETILSDITKAKERVDILIVSLHAGEEYSKEPSEFQALFSKSAVEAGADLIVGHHPHVVQALVPHTRADNSHGWIAYSLGNFIFDQDFSEETMRGAILKLVIENRKINNISLLPTRMNSDFQVFLEE